MTETEVYEFYNDRVKVAYSEIEAKNNALPIELLFEIHSAFDHLKRYHLGEDSEDEAAGKAFSHLKRGVLDAYKLKLKYFNEDYNRVFKKNSELRLIDSGKFLPSALRAKSKIIELAKTARLNESAKDVDQAFEYWYQTSGEIDEFEKVYFDSEKLGWAKKQGYFQFGVNFVMGVITGIIASIIVAFIL